MRLMGVDVGFSSTRASTGIACLDEERLHTSRVGTPWASRKIGVPVGFQPSLIAFDGPLLPASANSRIRRQCEFVFIRAPFHKRCKPGLSHSGSGLDLRRATAEACGQFGQILSNSPFAQNICVSRNGPVVEAFPNAFLGVLTSEEVMMSAPKLKRGRRFDWLYEQIVVTGKLESLLSQVVELPTIVWRKLKAENDHELRAALVCLLTAALADQNMAAIVGEETGGWFWLPPLSLWERWAARGLENIIRTMETKGICVAMPNLG